MDLVLQFDDATFSWNRESEHAEERDLDQGLSNISLRVEEVIALSVL